MAQSKPPRSPSGFQSLLTRSPLKKGRSGRVLTPGPSVGAAAPRCLPCSPAFPRLSLPPEDPSARGGSEAGASGKPKRRLPARSPPCDARRSVPLPDAPRRDLPGSLRAQGRGAGLWDPAFGCPVVPLPLGPHPLKAAGAAGGNCGTFAGPEWRSTSGRSSRAGAAEGPQRGTGARTFVPRGTGGQAETRTPGISQPCRPRAGAPWTPAIPLSARRPLPKPRVPPAPAAAAGYCGPGGRWRGPSGQERRPLQPWAGSARPAPRVHPGLRGVPAQPFRPQLVLSA